MAQLRSVPATQQRALGMIRVSKERDGMMSPEVQRTAITDYALQRGYVIVDWLEGIDQSGSRAKSAWWPRLDQAVGRVESGDVDVIVVWKFSRTARHRLKWAIALDAVESAGGTLESATEQIDTTTSMGKFTRGMLGELNAFEAERIGEGWREAHAHRLSQGLAPQGTAKYGYVWSKDRQVHEVDPLTGPVLKVAYERYLAGESFYALVRWLNGSGHKTRNGGMWSDTALRRVLDSGFAAGLIPWNGERHPGVHEALIDADTWQRYLDARARRGAAPSRRERSQYVLSGLVRCARCQGPMVAGQHGSARQPKYRCATGKAQGPAACDGGYVMATFVEAAVLEWLEELAAHVDAAGDAAVGVSAAKMSNEAERRRLTRLITKQDDALLSLAVQRADDLLTDAELRSTRAVVLARRDELAARVDNLAAEARRAPEDPSAVARGLVTYWRKWPVAQRRERLGELLKHVLVTTGRPHATFEIIPTWDA